MAVDNLPDDVEYYDNADQLLTEDDIIETDVRILGWKRKFRIRALTFGQMDKINNAATDKDGVLKQDLFVYWTIVEGVVRPKFKIDQAMRLKANNGALVQELSDNIWQMGRISKDAWDSFIAQSKLRNKIDSKDFSDLDEKAEG
jgi:hypothetical protein